MNKRHLFKDNQKVKFEKKNIYWLLAGIFLLLQVFITLQTATSGAQLTSLEQERLNLEEKKRILSEEIVRLSSLKESKDKAEKLGFSVPQKMLYVKAEEFVAKLP